MINLKEFKQSVLQKAMQGKLTKQLSSDGNASDLLVKIANKKRELYQAGKLKKSEAKPLSPITDKEKPSFKIPDNWEWTRLGNVVNVYAGKNLNKYSSQNKKPNSILYVKVKDMNYPINKVEINDSNLYLNGNYHTLPVPSLIFPKIGGAIRTNKRRKILKDNIFIDPNTMAINPIIKSTFNFLWTFMNGIDLSKIQSGTAMPALSQRKIKNIILPLPPLSEQKRIIVKVHKCFEFADAIQKERELNKKFAHDMKQSLLMEAMQGKLTKQLPSDGNADELLQKIQQKKQALIKAGKIRRHKKLPPISKDEIPFKIPKNWKWVRLGNIGSWKSGSTPRRNNKSYYLGSIPWLKTGDLNDNYITNTSEHISGNALSHSSLRLNPKGSVLIAMYGATIAKLGILKIDATTNQACCACIPYLISNKFLFYYLLSQRKNFISLGSGGAQPNISRTKIIHYVIPLPPLAEQERIVYKLKKLFIEF